MSDESKLGEMTQSALTLGARKRLVEEERDRLRAENEDLRVERDDYRRGFKRWRKHARRDMHRRMAAEVTMREVAEELHALVKLADQGRDAFAWANEAVEKIEAVADRLSPPLVVEKEKTP